MARHLIVSEPFGDYTRGSRITDAKEIAAVLDSDQAGHVLPIDVEDPPSRTSPPSAAD
jgi:hypothetical protein